MPLFLSQDERAAITEKATAANDQLFCRVFWTLVQRVRRWTARPGLDAGDVSWWHVVSDRLPTVAGMIAASPKAKTAGPWLREVTLSVARRPADDWIGPPFRDHRADPAVGNLETAHLSWSVALALDLAPSAFSNDEQEELRRVLRETAMPLCRRWFETREHLCNWRMIMLAGICVPAAVLADADTLSWCRERYRECLDLFQDDGSFDESLQYAAYAAYGLMLCNEALRRSGAWPDADCGPYARSVRTWAAGFLGMKALSGWGQQPLPRSVNFNDSAALFRPHADLLAHISARGRSSHPTEAGLARWLLEHCHAREDRLPDNRSSFGFLPGVDFLSLALLTQAAAALAPSDALPTLCSFDNGDVIARDAWQGRTILAVRGQHRHPRSHAHQHQDLNSFILSHNNERLLLDPGHCCYRSQAQELAVRTGNHNTCLIHGSGQIRRDGSALGQRRLLTEQGSVRAIAHDCAPAYAGAVQEFNRLFLLCGSEILFIVDRIRASEAVQVAWHFLLNNRDGCLEAAEMAPGTLVARRGDVGMKLVDCGRDGFLPPRYAQVHDAYHPEPGHESPAGSGLLFVHESPLPKREHLRVHAITLGSYATAARWHVKTDETGIHTACADEHWLLRASQDASTWQVSGSRLSNPIIIDTATTEWSLS